MDQSDKETKGTRHTASARPEPDVAEHRRQGRSNHDAYRLGVDGGGTKTHAVVTDERLSVLGTGYGGPGNFLRVGLERATGSVMTAIERALRESQLTIDRIDLGGIGLAGVQHAAHYRWMQEALSKALAELESDIPGGRPWDEHRWFLTTDAESALAGATEGKSGVVIISGTGSIAYGMSRSGERARSGGWGPTFGDEGSGHDIARRALMAAVAAYDGREKPTILTEKICAWYGIDSPEELPRIIYDREHREGSIAPLSRVVEEAALEGDEVAQGILRDAGRELSRAVTAVIERLQMTSEQFRVCYVGSVFNAGEVILSPIREAVREVAPLAEVSPPLFDPAIGAIILALGQVTDHDRPAPVNERRE